MYSETAKSLFEQTRELKILEIEQRIKNFEMILSDMKYELDSLKSYQKNQLPSEVKINKFNKALDDLFIRQSA
ncbi:MAG: hypothetical protein U0457_05515 [Candidatus Sericytochromatia bacterium]